MKKRIHFSNSNLIVKTFKLIYYSKDIAYFVYSINPTIFSEFCASVKEENI